ncbi:hypothetical protein G7Y89_g387 [Cudoniella acicularis]|uniref:Uncharacterized protein n=1 Tax=Cudoniella acicularis TaxID=354080 RepID=A0A8H4W8X3_9HELO|nr:hypothetical protein G7Y89_g387 [Cudoniella acicularis]
MLLSVTAVRRRIMDWHYSQCVPGVVAVVPPAADSGAAPTKTSSASVPPSTAGPGTVLQSGYYWIRAVEAPNFHKYLQSNPLYSEGGAILDTYTTAGQFQIVSGQLVQLITGGFLYAVVEKQANSTVNKLAVSFSKDKNTYGTFAFSGDAVQWSVPDIKRQNLSAWLVCGAKSLWINLGAYGYMTPTGCADETIHYYNDKTAVP